MYKLDLINTDKKLIVDKKGYDYLRSLDDIVENMQIPQLGFAVYRKNWKEEDRFVSTVTIIHKLIADRFLEKKPGTISFRNGNKLDCRIANLEYRLRKDSGKQGGKCIKNR